jgi:GTPase SAR1 family protein
VGQDLANEQQGLLDLIAKIQHAQLDGIKLPRIVVVGDQSAGKSSVLEAVTGIPFPRDAGACTRFATEIRLRRAKEVKFNVSILPDVNRQPHEKERLNRFAAAVQEGSNFETVMRRAVEEIAPQNVPGRFAAKDVLVVEKTAPDLPLLTVVDLPGLVGVANKDQSEDDMRAIDDLTNRYMKSSRTIILAIIGGNQDYVHQKVLTKARKFDPRGTRTIGVLTKPDVTKTIGLEDKFISLVNNQDSHNQFKLGWYVLRNPGPHDLGHEWTPEERQQQEDEFFSGGKWSVLPATMRGAAALKQKLSQQLIRHIARYVPKLRREIQQKLISTDAELKSLGTGKDTPAEMREDLVILSTQSQQLVTPAAEGTYRNPPGKKFFPKIARKADRTIPTPPQNLRARVVKENEKFADRVREQGQHLKLISTSDSGSPMLSRAANGDVSKEQYARDVVEPFIEEHMGTEFKGDYNPRLVYRLFHDFSDNWSQLAQEHKINVGLICNEFLAEVIDDSWPPYMREKLRTHFLDPQMNQLLENAQIEVEKLEADQQYEVQSYDPEYEKRLRNWQMSASTEERRFTTAEELLEKALIHYDLSAKSFISNVITQVVERHLLQGLYDIFNPVKVTRMTEQEVEDIALESIEIRERRVALKALKKNIQESLDACSNVSMRKDLRAVSFADAF